MYLWLPLLNALSILPFPLYPVCHVDCCHMIFLTVNQFLSGRTWFTDSVSELHFATSLLLSVYLMGLFCICFTAHIEYEI